MSNTARSSKSEPSSTVADKAKAAAQKTAQRAEAVAAEAAQSAARVADEAIDNSMQQLNAATRQGQSQVEDLVRSVGRAVEAASSSLEQDGYPGSAGYVRAAANGLSQAADEVDGFDTRSITSRVENFVREKPLIAAGGLALAGFVIASALRAPRR